MYGDFSPHCLFSLCFCLYLLIERGNVRTDLTAKRKFILNSFRDVVFFFGNLMEFEGKLLDDERKEEFTNRKLHRKQKFGRGLSIILLVKRNIHYLFNNKIMTH